MSFIFSKNQSEIDEEFVNKCPLCGKKIDIGSAKVIETKEEGPSLLFVECRECKGSAILAVINDVFGVVSFAVVTDLTMDDIERMQGAKKISSDEILDIYLLSKSRRTISEKASS